MSLVKLSDLLEKKRVAHLKTLDKRGILDQMSSMLAGSVPGLDHQELINTLLARESIMSTGIGLGIAVPHARLKSIDKPVIAVGICNEGISYESLDDKPVNIVVLIVVPVECQKQYLRILARVTLLLKNSKLRKRLLDANDSEEIFEILSEF